MSSRQVSRIETLLGQSSDKMSLKQLMRIVICTVSQSNNNNRNDDDSLIRLKKECQNEVLNEI